MPQTQPNKADIVRALYSRRANLDPKRRAIVDELAKRHGIDTQAQSQAAATKGEFEQNQPPKTVGSAIQSGLLAIPDALGITAGTIPETAANIAKVPYKVGEAIGSFVREAIVPAVTGRGSARGQQMLKDTARSMLVEGPSEMYEGYKESDPDKFTHGLVTTGMTTYPAARGIATGAAAGVRAARAPKVTPLPGNRPVKLPTPGPGVQQFVDAIDGGRKMFIEDRLRDIVSKSELDLKAAEKEFLGRPVSNMRDAHVVTKFAKDKAWEPYKKLLDDTTEPVTKQSIRDRAVAGLPEAWDVGSPEYKAAVRKIDATLQRDSYLVSELDSKAQTLNAKLKAHYKQNNLDRAASSKLPATAGDESLLRAYRELQDETILRNTGHEAGPLRQRYGNLKAIENALIDQPTELADLYDILTRPGYAPTPRGVFGRTAEVMLRRTPDKQVAKAFREFKINDWELEQMLDHKLPDVTPEWAKPENKPPLMDDAPRDPITGEILMPTGPVTRTTPEGGITQLEHGGKLYGEPPVRTTSGEQPRFDTNMSPDAPDKETFHPGQPTENQGQLFSIPQTTYKWQPKQRHTYTMKDLNEMSTEISNYLKSAKSSSETRRLTQDLKDINREIDRRKKAREAN